MQVTCVKTLQDISVYLTNLYGLLPSITGIQFKSDYQPQETEVSLEDPEAVF